MKLSPREQESLLTHQVGFLAQKRLARGVKLNFTETVALIASQIQELIRDGDNSVSELMAKGREMLGTYQVQPGVQSMVDEVQIEGTFPDGTKLDTWTGACQNPIVALGPAIISGNFAHHWVTVHTPINRRHGDLQLALYGSFLPVPNISVFEESPPMEKGKLETDDRTDADPNVTPGELMPIGDAIEINPGRQKTRVSVKSLCDRPIQVGSHYHFIEVNKYLSFDRELAYGKRLNITAGTAVRFEPGETKEVTLVEIGGNKVVRGGNDLCDGPVNPANLPAIMNKVNEQGFRHEQQGKIDDSQSLVFKIPRYSYIHIFGPTVGDKIRLGDTCLIVEVEKDFTFYGDECKFGGGKVLREGMGQAALVSNDTALDTVITNALVIDPVLGIIKADVGIKNGIIAGIGKAGNPDVMDGVTPGMIFGVGTEAIAGEGLILTAGAIDAHVHFICPQLAREAVASGITTMYGGGTGPATGTCATTCSPGPNHIKYMIQSTDAFPLNFGFTGKGNTSRTENNGESRELVEQLVAGAIGFKVHEDWGTTPAAIDHCLRVAEKYDVQVMIHTDTLNESSCVEQTIEAFHGRTIHTYHSEGAGGGHAPDIIKVCGEPNVLPSSTNPTRPYTCNTIDEHLDMLMVCHHLDKNLKEDVAFAESRIRNETIAAEDILHDLGAISIISSDSQAMGRIGEVICRTWQTADKMKRFRGRLSQEKGENDNIRVRRFLAKYTINAAISNGMGHVIGSIEKGKMADLVLWDPAFFGAKPEIIIKGGQIAWAQMGMPNASIPTPQPVKQRKQFGAYGKSIGNNSVIFVSQTCLDNGIPQTYGISKKAVAIKRCRSVKKTDMILNDYLPKITVNPQSYKVRIGDDDRKEEHITCPAANRLPLAQRYFLF